MSRRGYTFVEIMVAVAIIGIMAGIVVVGYQGNKNFDTLRAKTEELASALRAVRNRDFGGVTAFTAGTYQYPLGGYGLHLVRDASQDYYLLFADHDAAPGLPSPLFDGEATDEFIQKISLPTFLRVVFESVGVDAVEVMFKNNAIAIYHGSTGSWAAYASADTYVIKLKHRSGCTSLDREGIITIDTKTSTVYESIGPCTP